MVVSIMAPEGKLYLMGIDRLSFLKFSLYRRDFASLPLGTLLNYLAEQPNGVLVLRVYLRAPVLRLGIILERLRQLDCIKQVLIRN